MASVSVIAQALLSKVVKFFRQLEPVQFVVKPDPDSKVQPNIISYFDPKSVIAEEYRTVRTNLQYTLAGKASKAFLITSSVNQEGKTVTSINLAVILVQYLSTKPVLLVDCDMRRPTVHKYLGLRMEHGLYDYFNNGTDISSLIKQTEVENLHAVTCGQIPPNPSELLGSAKMDTFIREARERYEYIVFDTPPIIPVTDAAVLGPKLDGAVILIKTGDTQRETVNHAYRLLKQANTTILGFIMTNARQYIPKYLYRYQYYHYYHYYHYKAKE